VLCECVRERVVCGGDGWAVGGLNSCMEKNSDTNRCLV